MKIPSAVSNLISDFQKLPGIGPKSAQKLVFYLFNFPLHELEKFSQDIIKLKTETRVCSICKNVGTTEICEVCSDNTRDKNIIAVVSSPLDVFAFERAGYKGVYHVLHGIIDPLNNIGPDEIFISDLISRIRDNYSTNDLEVILATSTSIEGESTAMYISKLISDLKLTNIKVTRLGRGLPVGSDIEYADDSTLSSAINNRISM